MKQQRDALLMEKETSEKIAARAFAQSYLSDLVPSVFSNLSQNGFFYDPVERGMCTIRISYYNDSPCGVLNRGGVSVYAVAT